VVRLVVTGGSGVVALLLEAGLVTERLWNFGSTHDGTARRWVLKTLRTL